MADAALPGRQRAGEDDRAPRSVLVSYGHVCRRASLGVVWPSIAATQDGGSPPGSALETNEWDATAGEPREGHRRSSGSFPARWWLRRDARGRIVRRRTAA